jgi:hypothetical protein
MLTLTRLKWAVKMYMSMRERQMSILNNPKGYITYFSQSHSEYQQYLNENNRYATTEDKKIQEQIAQPILQEMLEENRWYNRE